jgi:N-acetylneuraminic acid mutarotase
MNIRNSLLFLIPLVFVISCNKDSNSSPILGNWMHETGFNAPARRDAVAFTVGRRAFIGTGYDGTNRLRDFWEYDADLNTWAQAASLPLSFQIIGKSHDHNDSIITRPVYARSGAVAFSTDTKGYIGTGFNGSTALKDFYQYDPATNKWDTIRSLGGSLLNPVDTFGTPRYSAIAFSINNIGYVGTGWDGTYQKDLWAYDPATNDWTQKAILGGAKRMDGVAFVINGLAYVCTGIDNGSYLVDMYAYNPTTNSWTQKHDIANTNPGSFDDAYDIKRIKAVGFTINGKGFIATGATNTVLNTCWEYDPAIDFWIYKTPFEGAARADAVAFVVDSTAYIATGANSGYYFDDIWAFHPNDLYNSSDKK